MASRQPAFMQFKSRSIVRFTWTSGHCGKCRILHRCRKPTPSCCVPCCPKPAVLFRPFAPRPNKKGPFRLENGPSLGRKRPGRAYVTGDEIPDYATLCGSAMCFFQANFCCRGDSLQLTVFEAKIGL